MRRNKLTKEDVNNRLSSRGLVMLGEYVNSQTKTQFKCNDGHTWEASPGNVMGGTSCPHCAGNVNKWGHVPPLDTFK